MIRFDQNEITSPTWRNLRGLFQAVAIDLSRCFFSNVYMGLGETESMMGLFPGVRDPAFVRRCLQFLELQIATIKPKLIISLGIPASVNLARLSPDLKEIGTKEELCGSQTRVSDSLSA